MEISRKALIISAIALASACSVKPAKVQNTYCNPIDIDYTYMTYNSVQNLSYRSGADPAVVEFRGEYYMFVTRSYGYWHSTDLTSWEFIEPQSYWYPQASNAPAAHNYKDSLLFIAGDPSGNMCVMYSDDPVSGKWKPVPAFLDDLQDPDLFIDDDGQAYMFWGSSNFYPIRGKKLNMKDRFLVESETVELFNADGDIHGWERFGENHSDTKIKAYIEGPWMTKHDGKYYMQYGAPGTEFNVYGDGVYVADSPLGPYEYQAHNPISYKPGGFMNGAGHGSTVIGPGGMYWHYGTMSLSATVNWERRICAFPTFFDADGIMYCNTEYGDYPHYAPNDPDRKGEFTGWMLLSYGKPVKVSSQQEGRAEEAAGFDEWNRPETSPDFSSGNLTDENSKTYWLAASNTDAEWLVVDLESVCDINALQINYYDHKAGLYGRLPGLRHRFSVEASVDGENWTRIVDRRASEIDAPNAYIQLDSPAEARYVRYSNVSVPSASLAISEFRVFGLGSGEKPAAVGNFQAVREADRRNAMLTWDTVPGAQGYNIRWGIAPDKLYNSWLTYGGNELEIRSLAVDQEYYFTIEAFSENGISIQSPVADAL